uniref:PexA n=1 Tax=uncultured bacterium Ak20-3 TaxID=798570 RepID=D9MX76_9BACT|nr:phenicol efflux MFS transporter PexA [uncultured bacterium Ak20-3]ADI87853.1 PexA [uncultured bacterium Ak20-3]
MKKFVLFCERNGIALIPIVLILLGCGLWPEMELLVPSLPDMQRAFNIQDAQIQQLLTANFVGFLIGVLFAGPLCDSAGRRTVMMIGTIGYLVSSVLCPFCNDFVLLMIARFFQGLFMTGPVIAGGVLLMEATEGVKQIFWMSIGNAAITFCMAAGPIVGSWINTGFGYVGNLWSILILGLIGCLPALFLVPESLPVEKRAAFHPKLLFKGYFALLKDFRFMCLAIPMCALAAAYWIYVGVSALYMVNQLGIAQEMFGRYQGPIVGCFSIISLGSSKLLQRFGLMKCLRAGIVSMFTGMLLLLGMSILSLDHAVATTVFMMFFVGGMAPICSMLFPYALGHLPVDLKGNAQAMVQAIRLFFASIGTSLVGVFYKSAFLPVALIMFAILLFSCYFLWKGRRYLKEGLGADHILSVGH